MIEQLKNNIDTEISMLKEIARFMSDAESRNRDERKIFLEMADNLARRIKIINRSIPSLLKEISLSPKLSPDSKKETEIENFSLPNNSKEVFIKKSDRKDFLEALNISGSLLKKMQKRAISPREEKLIIRKPNPYGKFANKLFLKKSDQLIKKGTFKDLVLDIRKSNIDILASTYISMMLFSVLLAVALGTVIAVFLTFVSVSPLPPFIELNSSGHLLRFAKLSTIIILAPLITGILFYTYPGAEKKSLAKKIDRELPFVVIHMGSIAGSGIEPIEIFKIIGLSKEYKNVSKEVRKIINQANVYGHDLTTSLKLVSASSPSVKLSELLNGMVSTINSGGDISIFLEKRAESLLLEYRLEREKSIKNAETFMDVYISIVIATPMILLLLMIMISVSGIGLSIGITEISLLIIGVVAIVNIVFLTFLHLKQPTY